MWQSGPGSPDRVEFQLASPRRQLGLLDGLHRQAVGGLACRPALGCGRHFQKHLKGLRPLKDRGGPGDHAGFGTSGMPERSASYLSVPFLLDLTGC